MSQVPRVKISERDLQDKFNRNEGGYPGQIDKLRRRRIYDEPAHPNSRQPPGTRSIVDMYYDDQGNKVMTTHHFLRSDGTLGGSGRLDPKELLVSGVMYFK